MAEQRCPSCAAANRDAARFCEQCGSTLAVACPSCGQTAGPTARFCDGCGTPLTAVAPTLAAAAEVVVPAAVTEVRQVSVLFVDLVGFTTLSESRDPEDVRALLSRYFDVARTVIDRYGGEVAKFIGDAVMAVWGTPVAREDDAERAVRAALELVAAVGAYGADEGIPDLQLRGGVVTGAAAAMTSEEGIVVGDRVNTASRIQGMAPPGGVLVDEVTRQATSAAIAYTDAGEVTLRGKAETVRVWQATRVVAGTGGAQRFDGLEAGYVGQTSQLDLVKTLYHATVDDSRARLVLVTGIAGVGKSRLAWEFRKYTDGVVFVNLWHLGRCLSYGEGITYMALAEMVRMRCRIAEDDPTEVAATKLAGTLAEYFDDEAERRFLTPRLGHLVGLHSETFSREELFSGWRLFFERLAEHDPVVMVFEDLQWADAGLLDFIDHLLEWSAGSRIFMLALARPDLLERRPAFGTAQRNATTLHLDPLATGAMDALLEDLVPGLPDGLRARIRDRAEGVPLYAVETIRMLIDRGVVVPRDGVYRLVGQVEQLDVPATLTSLIAARLDGLRPAERALVTDLSVLGDAFPRSSIAAVTDVGDAELDELLATLVRKELLGVRADPLSPERGHYAFLQNLVRKIAYDTLSKRDRRARHLRVAAHLREQFGDAVEDVIEIVADHYHAAYLAVPDAEDADAIRADALETYIRAARRAASLGVLEKAEAAYLTAIGLATEERRIAELVEKVGDLAYQLGSWELALERYETARAAHERAGRRREAGRVLALIGRTLPPLDRIDEASDALRASYDILAEGEPDAALAQSAIWLGGQLLFTGDPAAARPFLDSALELGQSLELPEVTVPGLDFLAMTLRGQHRHIEAVALQETGLALALEHGLTVDALRSYNNNIDTRCTSDLPGARQLCEDGMQLAQRLGLRMWLQGILMNRMLLDLFEGNWDEIEASAEAVQQELPGVDLDPNILVRQATVRALRGEPAAAREVAAKVLTVWQDSSDIQNRLLSRALDAAIALAEDRPEHALQVARAAAAEAAEVQALRNEMFRQSWPDALDAAFALARLDDVEELLAMVADRPPGHVPPYIRASLTYGQARLAAARGEAAAEAGFARAAAVFEELAYPFWRARVALDHARWLMDAGRSEEAAPLLALAGERFERLRAPRWSRQVDAVRDGVGAPTPT